MKKNEKESVTMRVLGKEDRRCGFREVLGRKLKEEKIVRVSRKGYIQINDLEDSVGAEEIIDRCKEVLGVDRMEVRVTSIAKIGGNRRAIVRLPMEGARKLADRSVLRIGFVVSRVILWEFADRCYSCAATGHYTGACKTVEKRGRCFRCNKEGHLARDCGR